MPTGYLVAITNDLRESDLQAAHRTMFGLAAPAQEWSHEQVVAVIEKTWANPKLELGYAGISCHPATARIAALVGEGDKGWKRLTPALREAILNAARIKAPKTFFEGQTGTRDRQFFWRSEKEVAAFLDKHAGKPLTFTR
jgi:hypothetical protein